MIYSEKITEEAQNGNQSNTWSVYAIHVTAEYEESKSGEVTESSSKEKDEYEYTNGFFVSKSHDNLLPPKTDDQQEYKAVYHAATQKFEEETKRYEDQVSHLLLLNHKLKEKHKDFESTCQEIYESMKMHYENTLTEKEKLLSP